jgi:hypothetical protein
MRLPLYLLIAVIVTVLTSCSAGWHLRRAIAKGLKIDTTRTQKIDSATVHGLQADGDQEKQVNMDSLLQNCRDLLSAAQNQKPVNQLENGGAQVKTTAEQIKKKIQRTVCPQESIDSTYTGTLSIQGVNYTLPLHVVIKANDGHLKWMVKLGDVKAPFVKEEIKTAHLQAGDTTWKNITDGLVGAGLLLLVLILLFVWSKFKNWI